MRLAAIGIYRKKYQKMFWKMTYYFWPSDSFGKEMEINNTYFSKVYNMYSHINTISAFITMGVLLCLPVIHGIKQFPFKVWVPLVDPFEHPYFEIILVWQWITNYWTVLFSILCYDYIYVMFVNSIICQLKMLQEALKSIASTENSAIIMFLETKTGKTVFRSENDRMLELLKVCIDHHKVLTE